jgi:hypothetical protein
MSAGAMPGLRLPSAELFGSRLVAALLVGIAIAALSPPGLLSVVIVLGQGHFFAAYFFQAKAGKIGLRTLVAWALAAGLLLLGFVSHPDLHLIVVVASLLFVVHFVHDEMFLLGEEPSAMRGLDILPIVLLYAGFLLDLRYEPLALGGAIPYPSFRHPGGLGGLPAQVLAVAACLALALNAALVASGRAPFHRRSLYFHLGTLGLLGLYLSGLPIPLEYLTGSVVLFHYLNWYLHYGFRYRSDGPRLASYVRTIAAINALVLVLYLTTGRHPDVPFPVGVLFLPGFFYLWTTLHILFTVRRRDLGFWWP